MKAFRDPVDEWLKETVGEAANPMVTMLGKLTDQQYDFARAFVLCGSPHKAAERVNLPKNINPAMLVHLPKVAACINILTAKREQKLGEKSAAEIMQRLANTELLDADDFGLSEAAVQEREDALHPTKSTLPGLDDSALVENLLNPSDPAAQIMQLPKVKVPQASSFGEAWVIERCVTIAERCLQIEPVYDKKGRPIGKFTFNAAGALKALEMLGKSMALFRDKVEVTGELSAFKESELDARIQALITEHPQLAKIVEVVEVKEVTH
jgi:hypothetical protein